MKTGPSANVLARAIWAVASVVAGFGGFGVSLAIWLVGLPALIEITGVQPPALPKLFWLILVCLPATPLWLFAALASTKADIELPEWTKIPAAIIAVGFVVYAMARLGMLG